MSNERIVLPQESAPLDLPPNILDLSLPDGAGPNSPQEALGETPATQVPASPPQGSQGQPGASTQTPEPSDSSLARSLSQIAKREKEQRERETALREREAKLQGVEAYADAISKKDAWALLNKMGLSYQDLTREYVEGKGPDPHQQVREEIHQVKEQLTQQLAEVRAAEERRRVEEERQILRLTIDNSDAFPVTKAANAHDLVQNAIQAHYQETGELASYEDAAAQVEQTLVDLVDRLMKVDTIRNRYVSNTTPVESSRDNRREVMPVTTLRNEDTQDRVALVPDSFDPYTASDEEMIERLASQLRYVG